MTKCNVHKYVASFIKITKVRYHRIILFHMLNIISKWEMRRWNGSWQRWNHCINTWSKAQVSSNCTFACMLYIVFFSHPSCLPGVICKNDFLYTLAKSWLDTIFYYNVKDTTSTVFMSAVWLLLEGQNAQDTEEPQKKKKPFTFQLKNCRQ